MLSIFYISLLVRVITDQENQGSNPGGRAKKKKGGKKRKKKKTESEDGRNRSPRFQMHTASGSRE
jgi:hypothetical protein